jgi:hypothetical protein
MHACLVNEYHAPAMFTAVLFAPHCGWYIDSEPPSVSVCEAVNLDGLPLYGGDCSWCRHERENDGLGSLGVLNASSRYRSSCSEMCVETEVLIEIKFLRVPVLQGSGFLQRSFQSMFGLCSVRESRFYQGCCSLCRFLQRWEWDLACVRYVLRVSRVV